MVNTGLIFGLVLLFGAVPARRGTLAREFTWAWAVPLATLVLAADGALSRIEGILILLGFLAWVWQTVVSALDERRRRPVAGAPVTTWVSLAGLVAGTGAMIVAGNLFVSGASGLARHLGIDAYLVGATVVALGTSLPELVTALLSRLRGHDEVGLGTLLGSNLFNGLAIVGLAATLHPVKVPVAELAVTLAFGTGGVLSMLPDRSHRVPRWRGPLLLALYAASLTAEWVAAHF